MGRLHWVRITECCHHATEPTQAGRAEERGRDGGGRTGDEGRPAGGNELGRPGGELNNDMRLAVRKAALHKRERLTTEGMMGRQDTDLLDDPPIQPRSIMVKGCGGTNGPA